MVDLLYQQMQSVMQPSHLDGPFERFLAEFRAFLDEALDIEPHGPAKHIRAYVRAMCAHAMTANDRSRLSVQSLMRIPRYQAVWSEFVDEVCGADSVDQEVLQTCRYAAEGLWYALIFGGTEKSSRVEDVKNFLLSLTQQSGDRKALSSCDPGSGAVEAF